MKIQSLKDLEEIEERARKSQQMELNINGEHVYAVSELSVNDVPALCQALREAWKRIEELET